MNFKTFSNYEFSQSGWWVEIATAMPCCTYYFGPFASSKSAQLSLAGYIEDLEKEGARDLTLQIKQCTPKKLTIFEEEVDDNSLISFCLFPSIDFQSIA
jgi:hypothetical protein